MLNDWPVLEVVSVSAFTAAVCYLVSHPHICRTPRKEFTPSFRLFLLGNFFTHKHWKFFHASLNSVQTSELVANLFQECDPTKGDYHGLCKCVDLLHEDCVDTTSSFSPTATGQNIFLLFLTAILKIVLTAWTFGMMVSVMKFHRGHSQRSIIRFRLVYSFLRLA